MRFLVQPTPDALARARPPVRAFLVFAALALVGLAAQRILNGGLTPGGVLDHYLAGGEPLPAVALWEEVHAGAFLYGFVLLMLGSLLAICPVPSRARGALFAAAFAATLADLLAPFLVVRAEALAAVRVVTFALALASMAALLAVVTVGFARASTPRRGHA